MAKSNHRSVDKIERQARVDVIRRQRRIEEHERQNLNRMGWQELSYFETDDLEQDGEWLNGA